MFMELCVAAKCYASGELLMPPGELLIQAPNQGCIFLEKTNEIDRCLD